MASSTAGMACVKPVYKSSPITMPVNSNANPTLAHTCDGIILRIPPNTQHESVHQARDGARAHEDSDSERSHALAPGRFKVRTGNVKSMFVISACMRAVCVSIRFGTAHTRVAEERDIESQTDVKVKQVCS